MDLKFVDLLGTWQHCSFPIELSMGMSDDYTWALEYGTNYVRIGTAIFGESWTMITTTVVDEIRRMLREGRLSQRKIASRIGVSRGTVNAIALGRRIEPLARRQAGDDGFIPPTGLPVRCPGCGGRVQMPCLLCYMRARQWRMRRERSNPCG